MSEDSYNCPPRCIDCNVCHRGSCDKPILISTCPFCHGSGITFHKQYGTERKCDECKGRGNIANKKLIKLDLL